MSGTGLPCLVVLAVVAGGARAAGWPTSQAEKLLVDRVGADWFREHLTFSPGESRFEPGLQEAESRGEIGPASVYRLAWRLRSAGQPFVDEVVQVTVTASGEVVSEVWGLPDCKTFPARCAFQVDALAAVRIAREAGLAPGVRPWETSFHFYHGELQRFVWTVTNTTCETDDGVREGDSVLIDASQETVLRISQWHKISCGNEPAPARDPVPSYPTRR